MSEEKGKLLRYVFKGAMILALLSIVMLFIVPGGSAEQVVLILSVIIDVAVATISGIVICKEKKDK